MRRIGGVVLGLLLVVFAVIGAYLATLQDSPSGVVYGSHAVVAGVLAFGLVCAFPALRRRSRLLALAAGSVIAGLVLEFVQSLDSVGRGVSALDVVGGTVGVGVGLAAALVVHRLADGSGRDRATGARAIGCVVVVAAIAAFIAGPVWASAPARRWLDCRGARPAASSVERTLAERADGVVIERGGVEMVTEFAPGRTTDPNSKDLVLAMLCDDRFTVSATVTPANTEQLGPRRIVAISEGWQIDRQNLVLGIQGTELRIRVRFRVGEFEEFAVPGVFEAGRTVKIAVGFRDGRLTASVDGARVWSATPARATLANWSRGYRLHVGNEATDDRRFEGDITDVVVAAVAPN